jgi:hypothetical protein
MTRAVTVATWHTYLLKVGLTLEAAQPAFAALPLQGSGCCQTLKQPGEATVQALKAC